jgi:hypothetical protein
MKGNFIIANLLLLHDMTGETEKNSRSFPSPAVMTAPRRFNIRNLSFGGSASPIV